jgi:hypothetical protein
MLTLTQNGAHDILVKFLKTSRENGDYEVYGVNIKDGQNEMNLYLTASALIDMIENNGVDVQYTILTIK